MLRSARLLAPSFALLLGCFGFGLGASSYGKAIVFSSSSAREAAPLAAPFLLLAIGAGASFALSAASAMDAAEKLSRSPRSRLS